MRYRQVHLDFHTSEKIPGIGSRFDAAHFQRMLQLGHVDSINLFAKCHHGLSYHPTTVGVMHPHLEFDLLGAQIEACRAIRVATPVYLSVGLDEHIYWRNPGWAGRLVDGAVRWTGRNDAAGFHELCLNTPYLDYVLAQIEEVIERFNPDGLWLDIVGMRDCWCNACVLERMEEGDPRDPTLIATQARRTYLRYTGRVAALIERKKPGLQVDHNGHFPIGDRESILPNTHFELESLPTGGWGYDHFPILSGYARTLGRPFLGMSGKFHLSWGEFGGYKHPNALRYEACAALSQGAAFSVGDQLHPDGHAEEATYALIGAAYSDTQPKEPWAREATSLAEVALLSQEAASYGLPDRAVYQVHEGDAGAVRMMLQGHIWFDVVDTEADWSRYRLLILPDTIRLDDALHARLRAYVDAGGRLLATGASGLAADSDKQQLRLGARHLGQGRFDPCYVTPHFELAPWKPLVHVVYGPIRDLAHDGGEILAHREDPYFNREVTHFCSHVHTPNRRVDAGPAIVAGPDGIWIAFDICSLYYRVGQQVLRDIFLHCVRREGGGAQIETNLPAGGRVSLLRQEGERRDVLHLLYAAPSLRGHHERSGPIEVIEDIVPLHGVTVAVRRGARPSRVTLEPQGSPVPFEWDDGRVRIAVERLDCHQMVVLHD